MAQDMGLGGAGMLGAAFGGAPRLRQAAYAQAQSQLASAFERAASAQKDQSVTALNRNRLEVLGSLADTFTRAGMDPAKAQLAAAAVAAASTSNPNQIIGAGQQLQAQDAGLRGDVQRMNIIDSARTGAPLPMTKIEGDTAFNPNLAPGAQDLATTPLGDAMIRAANARASASSASAARSRAGIGADKAGNYAIETDASGNMVRVNKLTGQVSPLTTAPDVPLKAAPKGRGASPQDTQTIVGFRQRIAAGKATPEQVAAFLVKQGRPDLAKQIFNPAYVVGAGYDDGGE